MNFSKATEITEFLHYFEPIAITFYITKQSKIKCLIFLFLKFYNTVIAEF